MPEDIADRAQAAFDRVKIAPENQKDGFVRLIELRNLVPDMITRIRALEAQVAQLEAGAVKVRKIDP